jgi:phosphoribosylanthranilate isomerase
MADVKICGLTDAAGLEAALVGGARYIGLVFFEKSPRHLSFERARALADRARGRAEIVAVTVDAPDEVLNRLSSLVRPDWIQAHGAETLERLTNIKRHALKGVIKAIGVAGPGDFAAADSFAPVADMLMFDAKAPAGASRPGGNALAFDWTMLKGRRFARPWMLSGGLNPENVAEAIALSGAGLVDVSSGVEAGPGVKDAARIAAFLAAAHGAPL